MDGSLASYAIPAAAPVETAAPSRAQAKPVAMPGTGPIHAVSEHEPNNGPGQANRLTASRRVTGAIDGTRRRRSDADFFRFAAKAGEQWVFEVNAARSKSKLDSYLEVLDGQGRRVPRVLLQAVRDSYFTFRGKNDSETGDFRVFNWDEMRINDYLYANGEVVKFWLFPRGPDSGFVAYPGPGEAVGAISIRLRWPMRSASRATSSSRIRRERSSSRTACRSSRSTTKTTTMRTASWARTRDCSSPRRRTASTWSRSRTCAGSRVPTSATR